jgi:hypothetical protein
VARLVVLVTITSAAVEPIFSQAKFILEACGEKGLKETLLVRLMEQTNLYNQCWGLMVAMKCQWGLKWLITAYLILIWFVHGLAVNSC